MAQWEKLRQLDPGYIQQLHELYDRDDLPMDVRHYLSVWIEKQDWQRAARDYELAILLFQQLLENLDIQHSRFNLQDDMFLMQHNIRRYKNNFQRYQEQPCKLASRILWFLTKEKEILSSVELAEQVEQQLRVEQETMEVDSQRDLERRMAGFRTDVQCMEHKINCLEEQQDEFDFKYQTYQMEAVTDEKTQKNLHSLINQLNDSRKKTLIQIFEILKKAEDLIETLVKKELVEWQRRQQKSCIGAPDNISLDLLEKWFTWVAACLLHVREFLSKLEELSGKVSYEHDPVKSKKPELQQRADGLLSKLLLNSFVVETQPSMPQGKGPLVLRTNVQFSVKVRFLVKFPELNHSMKVDVSIDSEMPQIKGYRRFNVLGTKTKALNMTESQSGGMVADFRHLTLKEQKGGGGGKGATEISLSVTEELHIINFDTVFNFKGILLKLQASSLPVVIISNSSQQQSAWASVLWFNMLSLDTKDIRFFVSAPAAPWPQFGEMLSWQFLSMTKRGLDEAQLEMIAFRLFGKQPSHSNLKVSWSKFSKENNPSTFWVWFDAILMMVKQYLADLWKDGLIMGFVTKTKEKFILKKKQRGTFLLRFSESMIGGITFSWVETTFSGEPEIKTVKPFTVKDLEQIPFHEIIRNFQLMEADNVPENPLLYLYPNTPKDEAFGKYYTEKTGENSPYIKYIKTKLMFVTIENTVDAQSPMPSAGAQELQPVSGLCGVAAEQSTIDPTALSLEAFLADPLLSPPGGQDLTEDFLVPQFEPALFNSELLSPEQVLPEFSLHEIHNLPTQFCSVFQ